LSKDNNGKNRVEVLKDYLSKEFGIDTYKDLVNACESAGKVDIGIFTTPIKTKLEDEHD
jgi:hypothetical protein